MPLSPRRPSVLVAEDDPRLAEQLRFSLKGRYRVRVASDRFQALGSLERGRPDLVLLDLCLPPDNTPEEGFRILRAARTPGHEATVVVLSAVGEREAALRAVSEGAYDFFPKPVDLETLQVVMARALERQALERENRQLRRQIQEGFQVDGLVGVSGGFQSVLEAIRRVKDSPVTVLITGESGTGKELVARAIHFSGSRQEAPFLPVHCSALPDTLLEAELFGHEKGAFTGATAGRTGRFEAADGGTLFLDEIASLNPATQIKLLRVLEERCIERLGSNRSRPVDIRLIAATNEDLEQKVRRGEFRRDLFFRLSVFPIRLPPLRERREDIPLLADHFLKRIAEGRGLPLKRFTAGALEALRNREWTGNARELLNLVETLVLTVDGDSIQRGDLPSGPERDPSAPCFERALSVGIKQAVLEFERTILAEAIARAGGAKGKAARTLRLDSGQMKYLTKKHQL
jgi:DNA-binding NtrC family response regulator